MTRPLRIGYLSDADPYDVWSWSGTHSFMARALEGEGFDLVPLGSGLRPRPSRLGLLLRKLSRRGGEGTGEPVDEIAEARRWARVIADELTTTSCDVLFAPVASRIAAFLETATPIVYLSDATFALLRAYYPELSRLPQRVLAQREELEARAIANASALAYSSAWAAASAVRDYRAPADRVHVIPFGANIDVVPPSAEVLAKHREPLCRLLFLGRDWQRKGGDIALEALAVLRGHGVDAELTVCGADAPAGASPPHVAWLGNLSKRSRRDRATLTRVLMRSHLMIVPTRADCTPIAFCEASAYGLPVVTTDTGGIPSLIEEGRNGFMLPLEAGGDAYARVIAGAWADDARYSSLVRSSRAAYDERLNWGAWAATMARVLRAASEGAGARRIVA